MFIELFNKNGPLLLAIALLILIYFGIRKLHFWLENTKPPLDPWEKEGEEKEDEDDDSQVPICTRCLRPVSSPLQHYCPNCGFVTGEYTRYIPFVNIRFYWGGIGEIIHKCLFPSNRSKAERWLLAIVIILFMLPLGIILCFPFLVAMFILRIFNKPIPLIPLLDSEEEHEDDSEDEGEV